MNPKEEYQKKIITFEQYLKEEEKSKATVEKYMRDVKKFLVYLGERELCKTEVIDYKQNLLKDYLPTSINSMLVAVNAFLRFCDRQECCVKQLKVQKSLFLKEEKELNKEEYRRLLKVSEGTKMGLVMQTIGSTGIRVSELKDITVEAVRAGKVIINCKNKTRVIFIPQKLRQILKKYIRRAGIKEGPVFVTHNGNPLNRSNIWRAMKALCKKAKVEPKKVFTHNLRHLFARTFYSLENDIVRLSDILGHSSINTTRIYTMETGGQHRNSMEKVQKILTT